MRQVRLSDAILDLDEILSAVPAGAGGGLKISFRSGAGIIVYEDDVDKVMACFPPIEGAAIPVKEASNG